MFMIGLELSLDRLKQLKRFIFGLGSAQILVTGLVIFFIATLFDNSLGSGPINQGIPNFSGL
jgi:CPA2 family monovalent cation:H+ antiporter-2